MPVKTERLRQHVDDLLREHARVTGLGELESADRKLRTLYAFMQSISTTFETQGLLDQIAANLLSVFPEAEVVGVHLRDPGTNAMVPRKTQRRDAAPAPPVPMAMQFHEEVVHKGRAVLSAPFALPTRKARPAPVGRGLTMHAPMIYRGDTSGVIMVQGAEASGAPSTSSPLLPSGLDLELEFWSLDVPGFSLPVC